MSLFSSFLCGLHVMAISSPTMSGHAWSAKTAVSLFRSDGRPTRTPAVSSSSNSSPVSSPKLHRVRPTKIERPTPLGDSTRALHGDLLTLPGNFRLGRTLRSSLRQRPGPRQPLAGHPHPLATPLCASLTGPSLRPRAKGLPSPRISARLLRGSAKLRPNPVVPGATFGIRRRISWASALTVGHVLCACMDASSLQPLALIVMSTHSSDSAGSPHTAAGVIPSSTLCLAACGAVRYELCAVPSTSLLSLGVLASAATGTACS